MLVVDKYYIYSMDEINREENSRVREEIIRLRNRELKLLASDYIRRGIIEQYSYMSLEDISNILDLKLFEITSNTIFPGQIVFCYPNIKEVKTTKQHTCDISGSIIKKGSICINYKMFMVNISDGYSYVLDKPWVSELGYRDFYPTTINELDFLSMKLERPFDYDDGYNYYDISKRKGEGIGVRKLGRR